MHQTPTPCHAVVACRARHPPNDVVSLTKRLCSLCVTHGKMDCKRDGTSRPILKEILPMLHDLVLATVFLAMIITPALLAMRSEREEKDVL